MINQTLDFISNAIVHAYHDLDACWTTTDDALTFISSLGGGEIVIETKKVISQEILSKLAETHEFEVKVNLGYTIELKLHDYEEDLYYFG